MYCLFVEKPLAMLDLLNISVASSKTGLAIPGLVNILLLNKILLAVLNTGHARLHITITDGASKLLLNFLSDLRCSSKSPNYKKLFYNIKQ